MKRTFRPGAASRTAGYPTLRELPPERRRLLLGLGAAALATALPACFPFGATQGEAVPPEFLADAGRDAATPDAGANHAPDAGAADAGRTDAEVLDGDPPMPDLPDGG